MAFGGPNPMGTPRKGDLEEAPQKFSSSRFKNGRRKKGRRDEEKGRERKKEGREGLMGMTEGGKRKECFHVLL